ncbi:MAG TPA: site-specific DNA-methyltransferase, partial [Firmicutes bacterium]|nr:site-specific DNA-methyltransferase [Bacillota bacterium]
EDFQKMLWEKKKFVTETFYVITVGNIPETFYPEIAENEAQWEEWEKILAIDNLPQDLFSGNWRTPEGRMAFLKAHPSLPLDTRHFPPDFTDRLLASFDDLDEMTDGLLIHSENWQALNLLQEKYRERVKCIYIDPPYNTGNDEFFYRDSYQHSCWLSMMADRLVLAREWMRKDGLFFASIDENEAHNLRHVCDLVFGPSNLESTVTWRRRHNQPNDPTKMIAKVAEYVIVYANNSAHLKSIRSFYGIPLTEARRGQYKNPDNDPRGPWESKPWKAGKGQSGTRYKIVSPTGKVFEEEWLGSEETFKEYLSQGIIYFPKGGHGLPRKKYYLSERQKGQSPHNFWSHDDYGSNQEASSELENLFGEANMYSNPKPSRLISRIARMSTIGSDTVLDYFAGSGTTGHAVINLNREDGGRRKFILVEMADYFDTVLLPRLKKVTFSPEWKDGKPKRVATAEEAKRGPRIIKVIRLESYEDALNNLSFDESAGQIALQFEDYLLKYMLRWETRKSETLLNVEKLSKPFDYCLHIYRDGETRVQKVDLPETFNYLIGLDVAKRQVLDDNGRCYLVYRGT